ncbi:hypothetical protein ACJ6WD_09820 [Streptomyces sp. VTCC 41912]|uniref:DUF7739 domain-containing protein n=1 Tax=Streptomyces sp. VTCC 41912 TaxID=3383243 RepID=UPI003896E3A6
MVWNISHGTDRHNEVCASYSHMCQLCEHLAHVLPAREWRVLKPAFGVRTGDPFEISAKDAGRMAPILRSAAAHRLMPAQFAETARDLADAADRAAGGRQTWRWR